jgi:hypothetical protein
MSNREGVPRAPNDGGVSYEYLKWAPLCFVRWLDAGFAPRYVPATHGTKLQLGNRGPHDLQL